jgi:hypothetical protein
VSYKLTKKAKADLAGFILSLIMVSYFGPGLKE